MNEYAETLLAQRLSMVTGVAQVNVFGPQKYAVRIESTRRSWRRAQIGIDEVAQADRRRRTSNLPTGMLYGPNRNFVVEVERAAAGRRRLPPIWSSRIATAARCGSSEIGQRLRRRRERQAASWYNGTPDDHLAIQRQPGTNTVEVVDR